MIALAMALVTSLSGQRIDATETDTDPVYSPQIIGGVPVNASDAPHQVRLEITTANGTGSLCGGSLLSSTWVLTAAHCLINDSFEWITRVEVIAGISTIDELGQRSHGATVYVHRRYSPRTSANDIGLIQLATPIALDGLTTATIALPVDLDPQWPEVGSEITISGWGLMAQNPDVLPHQLQLAAVSVQAPPGGPCVLSTLWNYDQDLMLCAGLPAGGTDSCSGDSGGPAVVVTDGVAYVAGVTSHGLSTCAQADYPGIYTRVTAYTSWILNLIARESGGEVPEELAAGGTPGVITDPVDAPVPSGAIQRVDVIGGPSVIADAVAQQISAVTGTTAVRHSGADRYSTAVAVSQAIHPDGVTDVYLASGTGFADALAASTALARSDSALLLTPPDRLTSEVRNELVRLGPTRVFLIGGTTALSSEVAAEVQELFGIEPVRLAGSDRYATATAVSQHAVSVGSGVVYLATGAGYADALSAAVALTDPQASLLLSASAELPQVTADEIRRLAPHTVYAIGGPAALNDSVLSQVAAITGVMPTRIFGENRSETTAAMSRHIHPTGTEDVFIVSGSGFADALAAAQGVLKRSGSLLLVSRDAIPDATETELLRLATMSMQRSLDLDPWRSVSRR